MWTQAKQIGRAILSSAEWRMALSFVWTVASGVLASAFVVEISTPEGVHWSRTYQVPTFYALIGLAVTVVFYSRALYRHETAIERFRDDSYCKAYMRSQCLPEAAERYKKLIRAGEVGELEKAMTEVRRILR
jgi:hypothetical protein